MSQLLTITEWAEEWLAAESPEGARPLVEALLGHVRTQGQHYRRRFEVEVRDAQRALEDIEQRLADLSRQEWA